MNDERKGYLVIIGNIHRLAASICFFSSPSSTYIDIRALQTPLQVPSRSLRRSGSSYEALTWWGSGNKPSLIQLPMVPKSFDLTRTRLYRQSSVEFGTNPQMRFCFAWTFLEVWKRWRDVTVRRFTSTGVYLCGCMQNFEWMIDLQGQVDKGVVARCGCWFQISLPIWGFVSES